MKNNIQQKWDAQSYSQKARFVPLLGKSVLDLLSPQKGEIILDLGCGDGVITSVKKHLNNNGHFL